jgi:hypothetical protein
MLSRKASCPEQLVQADGGFTTESLAGTRQMTTFRKDPTDNPRTVPTISRTRSGVTILPEYRGNDFAARFPRYYQDVPQGIATEAAALEPKVLVVAVGSAGIRVQPDSVSKKLPWATVPKACSATTYQHLPDLETL